MPFSEQHIRQGLDRSEFVPHFQPLVDLRSGEINGFEILARWNHPTRGLVAPHRFIPLVERFGFINDLSICLLTQAFATARDLPKTFGLSVNLSPAQLHDRLLPGLIVQLADTAEFDLRRLTVELTESALVDDLALASAVASDLKSHGIRIALDDFGTGYSSLLHLQALPFDELKVDISFVRSMVESRQSRKITAAVVGLGISLGLNTVAEGIEEQAQANLLAWQGCRLGQGFLYGKAVPAGQLAAALAKRHPGVDATEFPASFADSAVALDARPTGRLPQLRAIYDGAPVGLAFVDCDLRYVSLNQRFAQMNGQSVQAHLGRKVSDIVPPGIYAQFEPYLLQAIAGESVKPFEVQRPPSDPDTPPMTFLGSYEPVRDEAGEILGVSISVADISAVKQKEEALRQSEEHYRNTVEFNPGAPWVMDTAGNITISSKWEQVTGLTQEEISQDGWLHIVHQDDLERITAQYKHSLETGDPMDLELRVCAKDGTWIWLRSRGSALRDEAGKIIRWYGSVECIEDHKLALKELRRSEARLRAILAAAPVGMVIAEAFTGKVLHANPRAEELLGIHFTSDMAWNLHGWEAFDRNGQAIEVSQLPLARALRKAETTDSEEILLHRHDGSRIWLSITAAPIRLENGDQLGGVLIVQEAEAARLDRNRSLETAQQVTQAVRQHSVRQS